MDRVARIARALVVPAIFLAAWEGVSRAGWVSPIILPAPTQVLERWIAYARPYQPYDPAVGSRLAWLFSGELVGDALSSLMRVAVGFAIGAGLALPIGLLMGAKERVYQLLNPMVQLFRPIPPIAFIPLAILWFGLGGTRPEKAGVQRGVRFGAAATAASFPEIQPGPEADRHPVVCQRPMGTGRRQPTHVKFIVRPRRCHAPGSIRRLDTRRTPRAPAKGRQQPRPPTSQESTR